MIGVGWGKRACPLGQNVTREGSKVLLYKQVGGCCAIIDIRDIPLAEFVRRDG